MLRRRGETVAAPATAPGRAALAVVRVTGPRARQVLQALAGRSFEDRRPVLAMLPGAGRAVVTLFLGPRSYTGEDLVEVALHGNPLLEEMLLRRLAEEGVIPALPGEFTFRAVLNGKMDLVQAEGIAALVEAETPLQVERALAAVQGDLSVRLRGLREGVTTALAVIQAAVEFPEEEIGADRVGKVLREAAQAARALAGVCLPAPLGGVPAVALAGPPNAGKSTLFNRLAGGQRAMVSPIPGTTRDGLKERLRIGGREISIEDTAGLFASDDPLTAMAADRAEASLDRVHRILWLADASKPRLGQGVERAIRKWGGRVGVAANKADLGVHSDWKGGTDPVFSALTGEGMEGIESLLRGWADQAEERGREASFFLNWRQEKILIQLADHLEQACARAEEGALELAAQEVLEGAAGLADLLGEISPEVVLDRIFESFCIGK